VRVTGVEGRILYGAGGGLPTQVVKSGQEFGPGTFSAGNDGILYLSAFDGSELRLSETGTLTYDGDDRLGPREGAERDARSNFHLRQGKAQITIRFTTAPHWYHLVLSRATASIAQGQAVMCMHGTGTYVFVARGRLAVTDEPAPPPVSKPRREPEPIKPIGPFYGAVPAGHDTLASPAADQTQWLVGNGKVGVIGIDGDLRIEPLSALTAGTQTCLLAGFKPAMAEGAAKATDPDTDAVPRKFRRFPVVSPTQ
jgi:hypothetical protein